MTRTGRSPRLSAHIAEPFVEIHPADAATRGIAPASLVEVESPLGRMVGRALVSEAQQRGTVFAPMHWTDRLASRGRIGALIAGRTDPVSGQPGLKEQRAEIRPFAAAWYGFAVLRDRPAAIPADYWALAHTAEGWRLELADRSLPADWTAWAERLVAAPAGEALIAYHDAGSGHHRFASPAKRLRLLAGRAVAEGGDAGPIICGCLAVGSNDIARAVIARGCLSVEAVGAATGAGTSCGSCRPEIRRIIHERAVPQAV